MKIMINLLRGMFQEEMGSKLCHEYNSHTDTHIHAHMHDTVRSFTIMFYLSFPLSLFLPPFSLSLSRYHSLSLSPPFPLPLSPFLSLPTSSFPSLYLFVKQRYQQIKEHLDVMVHDAHMLWARMEGSTHHQQLVHLQQLKDSTQQLKETLTLAKETECRAKEQLKDIQKKLEVSDCWI